MANQLGISVRLRLPFADAREKTINALKQEGFGVLTEIDVKSTLKQKLNVDFRPYTILGACNPPLAHRALSSNADVGLLLPCNVTVAQEGDAVVVVAIDPMVMLGMMKDDPVLRDVAKEAQAKLKRAIDSLSAENKSG